MRISAVLKWTHPKRRTNTLSSLSAWRVIDSFYSPKQKWPSVSQWAAISLRDLYVRDKQKWHKRRSVKRVSLSWAKVSTPGTCSMGLVSVSSSTPACLANSSWKIINLSYLLSRLCTFGGYIILEIKLNVHSHWVHLTRLPGPVLQTREKKPPGLGCARKWVSSI